MHIEAYPEDGRLQESDIRPCMTAVVDTVTGHHSVANYLLKPLQRGLDDALQR